MTAGGPQPVLRTVAELAAVDGFFSSELSRGERRAARRAGRSDGARGVPAIPAAALDPAMGDRPMPVFSAWVDGVQARVDAAGLLLAARLLEDNRHIAAFVYRRAAVVVHEHDARHALSDAARGRFLAALAPWRAVVAAGRPAAAAATAHGRQCAAEYWRALARRHPMLSSKAGRPRAAAVWIPIEIDPRWTKPADLLLAASEADDEISADAARTLRRALEIVTQETGHRT